MMSAGRPLLYLSLPGVAFILGVFWYRRRSKNNAAKREAEGIEEGASKQSDKKSKARDCNYTADDGVYVVHRPMPGISMNIDTNANEKGDDNCDTKQFGKSAPIKIVHNSKSSPKSKATNSSELDCDELKSKIQNADNRHLEAINEEENLSSPADLPDSVNKVKLSFRSQASECKDNFKEPIIIKATNTPKISPENSFLDNKYIESNEQNSNNNNINNSTPKSSKVVTDETLVKSTDPEEASDSRISKNVSPTVSISSAQSSDSGKGSSLPRCDAGMQIKTKYEFFFPNALIGYLYGRKHTFINQLMAKTGASVSLRTSSRYAKLRICVVEGTENQINAALVMIRNKLPSKRYPHFTMQRIHYVLPQTIVPLSKESLLNLKLSLIEGINNDVVVSAIISGGHLFVQHPLHPSHPSLQKLQKCLFESYTNSEAPLLPSIEMNAVCVMPVNGIWYRVQIVETDAMDSQYCLVKFLDFGGYLRAQYQELRQIRSDFMSLPFQATECVLSNIEPAGGCWPVEATDVLRKLTGGIVLQAQVAGYNESDLPEIYLFASLGPRNVVFINKELAARGLAKWVEPPNNQ